ncbi:unnamed protein product [Vitrella brassicaformis CCMP3155]|uniref:Pectin acetylesterase n=1 Tax=Vitrella brassicaformis (strain CCMP3155) TaxID=1169540 RepID=A0A0G4FWV3_VITBC|nr:unnamed protein product [Vitrella brassicaformis CCMP3155]|eukprot:CEM19426.1 unnamed protein product [Vitrella brassicaformis CCMP3155]
MLAYHVYRSGSGRRDSSKEVEADESDAEPRRITVKEERPALPWMSTAASVVLLVTMLGILVTTLIIAAMASGNKHVTSGKHGSCLDGSPPAYHLSQGAMRSIDKWLVHLSGGGWCTLDQSEDTKFVTDHCALRATTPYGTSRLAPNLVDMEESSAYFNRDAKANPLFHDWNYVWIWYCDGSSYSSNLKDKVVYTKEDGQPVDLYFKGHGLLVDIFEDLLENQGMNGATDVVISGCSAGGLGVLLNVDWLGKLLPEKTFVTALPDSGFFLEWFAPAANTKYDSYAKTMKWIYESTNASSAVNQECVRDCKPET